MKDLFESILDDEDVIISKADTAAEFVAAGDWLKAHGVTGADQVAQKVGDIARGSWYSYRHYFLNEDPTTHTWTLDHDTLTITDKDKTIPSYVKIASVRTLNIQGWKGETLPFNLNGCKTLSIRNCPNLKSLRGCPQHVESFAVSGCPKLMSLDGAPQWADKLFKAINNGKDFTDKDIKRVCKVDKKNMIY